MSHGQSPRGTLRLPRAPLNGSNGQKAAKLEFDVDLDIDWEGLGFGSPTPRPTPAPASERKPLPPLPGCESAPVSRIGEKSQNAELATHLNRTLESRSEEEEPPTRVYARRSEPPAPVEVGLGREPVATPAPDPVLEGPRPAGSSTLVMTRTEVVGDAGARGSWTSGQTLVMTHDQLRGRAPKPALAEATSADTKLMSIDEVVGGRGPRDAELASGVPLPEGTDEDSGPHTKMMPIDVLMKRANAQQRWPLPGVAIEAQLRDSDRGKAIKRTLFKRLGDGWRNTSLVRKASLFLMPLLCAVILVRYSKLMVAPKAPRKTTAVASASVARKAASAQPSPELAPTASALRVSEQSAPGEATSALPAGSLSAAPPPVAVTGAPPASSAESAPAAGAANAQSPASAGAASTPAVRVSGSNTATAQRKAADAVAEGDYAAAVERYRSLARDEPGVPVYQEAARILEERANGTRR